MAITTRSSATLAGFAAILFWSTSVALVRSTAEQVGPVTSGALAYLASGVVGCAYLAARGRLGSNLVALDRRYLLVCGALFVFYEFCLFIAVGLARSRIQSIEIGLVNYLWPTLTLLLSVPILRMRARAWLLPGVLVATTGVVLATMHGQSLSWNALRQNAGQNPVPYALGLGAAVSWGLYSTLCRRWGGVAGGGAVPAFLLATGLTLGTLRFFVREPADWNARVVFEILYMASVPNVAYVLWDLAMRRGDMVLVASASYATPLLSTVVSCLYLGVFPGAKLWLGVLLIVAGAVVCRLSLRESTGLARTECPRRRRVEVGGPPPSGRCVGRCMLSVFRAFAPAGGRFQRRRSRP